MSDVAVRLVALDESGREFACDSDALLVGRERDCQVHLQCKSVSRRHALIMVVARLTVVVDLVSRQGTTVNGQPLTAGEVRVLQHADQLGFGRQTLRVCLSDAATGAPLAPSSQADSPSNLTNDDEAIVAAKHSPKPSRMEADPERSSQSQSSAKLPPKSKHRAWTRTQVAAEDALHQMFPGDRNKRSH